MLQYRTTLFALTTLAVLTVAQTADARNFRSTQIPNNMWSCGTCHTNPTGSGPRNDFGKQVEDNLASPATSADVDWQAIYDKDADGDGFTNGEELGDPMGNWSPGDDNPDADDVTNPSDPSSKPSGGGGGDTGGTSDTGGMADAGNDGIDPDEGDDGYACSTTDGRPVRGLWLALVLGVVGLFRRRRSID